MSAATGRRIEPYGPSPGRGPAAAQPLSPDNAPKRERRRRELHFRRRRRDLLVDTGMALVTTIALISTTAGLGVLVLIEFPLAAAVIVSMLTERTIRRRRAGDRRTRRRSGP